MDVTVSCSAAADSVSWMMRLPSSNIIRGGGIVTCFLDALWIRVDHHGGAATDAKVWVVPRVAMKNVMVGGGCVVVSVVIDDG